MRPRLPGHTATTGNGLKTRVFISYSHQDLVWLQRLHVHLKPLMRTSQVDFWDDTRVQPGMDWKRAVENALSSASVAVLLVSPHYLASDSIVENQLTPLLEGAEASGTTILSVIVAPCLFQHHHALARYQTINPPTCPLTALSAHEADEILVKLVETILKQAAAHAQARYPAAPAVNGILPPRQMQPPPYPFIPSLSATTAAPAQPENEPDIHRRTTKRVLHAPIYTGVTPLVDLADTLRRSDMSDISQLSILFQMTADPGVTGTTVILRNSPTLIGRDSSCDIFINDVTLSRRHAQIELVSNRAILYDLTSANGTKVNGHRLGDISIARHRVGGELELCDGDVVELSFTTRFLVSIQ